MVLFILTLIIYTKYLTRLQHPVAPAEPVNDKKRMVAILPYTKMPDTDEITFQKGIQ
jgi:hypothetical protein